jgi:(p)ppGpp synthase/HD superfamily hydrolase
MPTLEDAIALAVDVHRGQVDKAGWPYILHPLRVMLALETEAERIVGVLHDVVEDSGRHDPTRQITIADLRAKGYSEAVLEALDRVTKRDDEDYGAFIARVRPSPLARRVKLADIADNLDVRRLPTVTDRDANRLNRYLQARKALLEPE